MTEEKQDESNPMKLGIRKGIHNNESNVSTHKTVTENPDSIAFGSAAKGSLLKVYGDFNDLEAFKKKVDNAKKVRDYAQGNLAVNV